MTVFFSSSAFISSLMRSGFSGRVGSVKSQRRSPRAGVGRDVGRSLPGSSGCRQGEGGRRLLGHGLFPRRFRSQVSSSRRRHWHRLGRHSSGEGAWEELREARNRGYIFVSRPVDRTIRWTFFFLFLFWLKFMYGLQSFINLFSFPFF